MHPYCEIMAIEIFPQIRSLLARELIDTLGFTQQEAALKIGITQPAVSQYKKEMRATKISIIESYPQISQSIKNSAKLLAKTENTQDLDILCDICKEIRASGILNELHQKSRRLNNCPECCDDKSQV